ncbi:MAG TPA: tol-pal system protein YbgF [Alphaproteobacteria bacterium]|nr:tol-pal system protein YbgF [Alphaproteobacteria bacterium]
MIRKAVLLRAGAAAFVLFAFALGGTADAQEGGAAQNELRLQQLEDQVRSLTGQVETQNHQIDVLNQQIEKMKADTELRLNDLEGHGGAAPGAGGQGAAAQQQYDNGPAPAQTYNPPPAYNNRQNYPSPQNLAPQSDDGGYGPPTQLVPGGRRGPGAGGGTLGAIPPGPVPSADPDQESQAQQGMTPQAQYQAAYALIGQGQFGAAEQAFRSFLSQYPKDPLASSAAYWVGHSYYARGDFQKAAIALADGYKKYPKGIKAPDTLLELGRALAKLDQVPSACATYAQFDKQFAAGAPPAIKKQEQAEKTKLKCG